MRLPWIIGFIGSNYCTYYVWCSKQAIFCLKKQRILENALTPIAFLRSISRFFRSLCQQTVNKWQSQPTHCEQRYGRVGQHQQLKRYQYCQRTISRSISRTPAHFTGLLITLSQVSYKLITTLKSYGLGKFGKKSGTIAQQAHPCRVFPMLFLSYSHVVTVFVWYAFSYASAVPLLIAGWQQNFSVLALHFQGKAAFDLGGTTTKASVLSASGGAGKDVMQEKRGECYEQ
jgi:hypothetical protein